MSITGAILNAQRSLAHLKRKARGLAQSLDREARELGEAALIVLHVVFKQARDGPEASVYGPDLQGSV